MPDAILGKVASDINAARDYFETVRDNILTVVNGKVPKVETLWSFHNDVVSAFAAGIASLEEDVKYALGSKATLAREVDFNFERLANNTARVENPFSHCPPASDRWTIWKTEPVGTSEDSEPTRNATRRKTRSRLSKTNSKWFARRQKENSESYDISSKLQLFITIFVLVRAWPIS